MIGREQMKKLVKLEQVYAVPDTNVMIAVLVLHTGFVVLGQSGCVQDMDFDEDTGARLALNEAYAKLAAHEAYLALDDMAPDDLDADTEDAHPAFRTDFGASVAASLAERELNKAKNKTAVGMLERAIFGDQDSANHSQAAWHNWKLAD